MRVRNWLGLALLTLATRAQGAPPDLGPRPHISAIHAELSCELNDIVANAGDELKKGRDVHAVFELSLRVTRDGGLAVSALGLPPEPPENFQEEIAVSLSELAATQQDAAKAGRKLPGMAGKPCGQNPELGGDLGLKLAWDGALADDPTDAFGGFVSFDVEKPPPPSALPPATPPAGEKPPTSVAAWTIVPLTPDPDGILSFDEDRVDRLTYAFVEGARGKAVAQKAARGFLKAAPAKGKAGG